VRSSEILLSAELYFFAYVLAQTIRPNFKGQAVQENYSWTSWKFSKILCCYRISVVDLIYSFLSGLYKLTVRKGCIIATA
jgi:hypothetical protein